MTEDSNPKVPDESTAAAIAGRQRKKRKWDQPAESLISAGVAVPGVLLGMGGGVGVSLPGAVPLNGVPATFATVSQLIQSSSLPQSAAAIVQKLNQPKIQDELIAREIVINDAEPAIRYKLTKRQTQEEIQKCTGAVVITRGKYRPLNGLPDSEKPLYLHISAGSHMKDTVERIKAVDHAASMVEEILKQGQNSQPASTLFLSALGNGQVTQPWSACVYLGFDADPSLNIAARIRGPNDQYINHIMNETGATVVLSGQGSGNLDGSHAEAGQQPLHLHLSSINPKSLEDARMLAENLMDTISAECGASRISSSKVYSAVPPPQQLMAGVQNSKPSDVNSNLVGLPCTGASSTAVTQSFPPTGVSVATGSNVGPPGTALQSGALLGYGSPPNMVSYIPPSVTRGTCYSGYEGIYPQATPLQQVALALRQAPVSTASVISSSASLTSTTPKMNSSSNPDADKRHPQKRKFQELPVTSKEPTVLHQNSQQGSEFLKPGSEDSSLGGALSMPPPKLVEPKSNGMLPPPPRNMPPPPPKFSLPQSAAKTESEDLDLKKSSAPPHPLRNMPPLPPKFSSGSPPKVENRNSLVKKSSLEPVSDILLKLVEYGDGDEDDDVDDTTESPKDNPTRNSTSKPFWAV